MNKILLILLSIIGIIHADEIPDEALINLIDITGQIIGRINKDTLKLLRNMCPPLLHITIEKINNIYNMPTGLQKDQIITLLDQLESGNITPFAPSKVQPNRYVPKNVVDLDAGAVAQ